MYIGGECEREMKRISKEKLRGREREGELKIRKKNQNEGKRDFYRHPALFFIWCTFSGPVFGRFFSFPLYGTHRMHL